ncbi:MAG: type II secretion system protein GspC [Synergistota bacterium]|nr:type II secretion system protein GspC [Synergistota bacterium]
MKDGLSSILYELKDEMCELFRNGYHSDGKKQSKDLVLSAVSFLAGLIIASVICFFMEFSLLHRSAEAKYDLAAAISKRVPSLVHSMNADPYRDFSDLNPFGALMPGNGKNSSGDQSYQIEDMSLAGTLPGIGAWIRDRSLTRFILKGEEINGYELDNVKYLQVTLLKGGQGHLLFMNISTGNMTPPQRASVRPQPRNAPPKKAPQKKVHPGIEPASEGVEGVVPRELVDKLLMNPYDEIAKMRMIPAEGGGMQLARIDPDSVLGMVGVQKGDIIKAVNGVEISNLSDATNAVNSMMSGTRFDVKVERSGKPLELKYQVK